MVPRIPPPQASRLHISLICVPSRQRTDRDRLDCATRVAGPFGGAPKKLSIEPPPRPRPRSTATSASCRPYPMPRLTSPVGPSLVAPQSPTASAARSQGQGPRQLSSRRSSPPRSPVGPRTPAWLQRTTCQVREAEAVGQASSLYVIGRSQHLTSRRATGNRLEGCCHLRVAKPPIWRGGS